jgi:hypothetical protein
LDYPEWEAGHHCCSLFVSFIREEVFESFDGTDTCFLEVADNDAVLQNLISTIFEDFTHPTPGNFCAAIGDKTGYTVWHFA